MRQNVSLTRVASLALLAVGTLAVTGCFHKGARGDYALAPEMRPLEVPPGLTVPAGGVAAAGDEAGSVLASQASRPAPAAGNAAAAPAAAASGFTVAGGKDEVFEKLGTVLEGVEGVTVASRAKLLGSYDVAYEGSNFLVRVVAVDAGAYVSAVDPRGLPATTEAPLKLVAAVKAKLAP